MTCHQNLRIPEYAFEIRQIYFNHFSGDRQEISNSTVMVQKMKARTVKLLETSTLLQMKLRSSFMNLQEFIKLVNVFVWQC